MLLSLTTKIQVSGAVSKSNIHGARIIRESEWARVVAAGAGKDRGTLWIPEVGDEVLVAFDKGDIDHPFVLGGLWNGSDVPPETNKDGDDNTKLIRTRSGNQVKFFDSKTRT